MLRTLVTLFLFQFLGELFQRGLDIPVPGAVLGMLLFLGYLMLRNKADTELFENAGLLLKHLPLFFIPAGAGLMLYPEILLEHGLAILASLVLGTLIALAASAKLIQLLLNRRVEPATASSPQSLSESGKDEESHG